MTKHGTVVAAGDHEFSCTIDPSSLSNRITVPNSCEASLDYVHRNDCGQGFSTYRWLDHGNEYSVSVHIGFLTGMQAVGAVGAICGIDDSTYRTGTILAAPVPADARAPDQCPLCSVCDGPGTDGSTSELPRCEPCDPKRFEYNHESLEDFCQFHGCPADVAAAEASMRGGTVPSFTDTCADASTCTLCTYPSGSVPEGSAAPPPACAE